MYNYSISETPIRSFSGLRVSLGQYHFVLMSRALLQPAAKRLTII